MQRLLTGDQRKNQAKKRIRAEGQCQSRPVSSEPEIISNLLLAKNFGREEVKERNSGVEMKTPSGEDSKGCLSPQNSSPDKKSPFRKNSEAFKLSTIERRPRVASVYLARQNMRAGRKLFSGQKILVKSKFGAPRSNLSKNGRKKKSK